MGILYEIPNLKLVLDMKSHGVMLCPKDHQDLNIHKAPNHMVTEILETLDLQQEATPSKMQTNYRLKPKVAMGHNWIKEAPLTKVNGIIELSI
jgi:hypothetical protein